MTARADRARRRPRRGGVDAVLLRELPRRSVVHDLWPGTKLVCLAILALTTLLFPGWPAALIGPATVLVAAVAARVPPGAVPRLPIWFWVFFALGALTSFYGSGLAQYLQLSLIALALLAAGTLVGWTTPVAELAPAVAVLGAPLRRLRAPVGEWAVGIALCARALPLLLDELRTLLAARRLRPHALRTPGGRVSVRRVLAAAVDLLTAAMAVSTRRAAELGQAITARGGVPATRPPRPHLARADGVAVAVVLAACAAVIVLTVPPAT